jgi:primosomal protein N' (replication factor Y)
MFVEVAFPLPVRRQFTYSVPVQLRKEVTVGVQVLAPLGSKVSSGLVTKIMPSAEIPVKPILQVGWEGRVLSGQLLELTKWLSNYYFCSWGEAIKAALPKGLQLKPQHFVAITSTEVRADRLSRNQAQIVDSLLAKFPDRQRLSTLVKKFKGIEVLNELRALEAKKLVELSYSAQPAKARVETEKLVRVNRQLAAEELNQRKTELLNYLLAKNVVPLSQIKKNFSGCTKLLRRLETKKIIELQEVEVAQDSGQAYPVPPKQAVRLSDEQAAALERIQLHLRKKEFAAFLLYGVTGSGKTEVYIQACKIILEQGRTALILVPEISLTIQTIANFRSVFGDQVITLHSGLSDRQRLEAWRQIRANKFAVVIGVRSAIFAPLENLGLVVVDEEQDNSYKQSDAAPRYHARDLALVRGKLEKALVILGSATPSLESYHNALTGKYTLLSLRRRVLDRPQPGVAIIDLKSERNSGNYGSLSGRLKEEVSTQLRLKQQAILFLNRRGFSTLIKCRDCGYVPPCRNCNITLTFHLQGHWLRCHFCGYQRKAPTACPACHSLNFQYRGTGTQRIESEVKKLFGPDSLRRLDSDLSYKRNYTRNLLLDFQTGRFSILLGTQMVTKGYDFPEVTLVGVISADTVLELPDFRAGEKTFQLLTQVAGRCGRGDKPGKVLIQTSHPQESTIQLASRQDYEAFFQQEIKTRRQLEYPPYCHLIMLLVSGVNRQKVEEAANRLKENLSQAGADLPYAVLGPAFAPLQKIRRRYRQRLMLKTKKVFETLRLLEEAIGHFSTKGEVRVAVDVDPLDML